VRSERRRDLLRILHEGRPSSQQEIVRALRSAGHDVTQATVSRDLREVGATKIRVGERFVYCLADDIPRLPSGDLMVRNLARTLAEFALDIRTSSSFIVVLTAPGHAAAVARAIDIAGLPEVVGTVAGDDTIFVATTGVATAESLTESWVATGPSPSELSRMKRRKTGGVT
jgi:transcriptional regulator of arginine metabolism